MNLYLTRSGKLRRKDNTLQFDLYDIPSEDFSEEEHEIPEEQPKTGSFSLPVETVDAIYIFGEITLNSKLAVFLGQKKIPVHFFNYYGHHTSTLLPHGEQISGELVIRQAQSYGDREKRMQICRTILDASIHNILSILQNYARKGNDLSGEMDQIKDYQARLKLTESPEEAMGLEGNVRSTYYQAWHKWLGADYATFKRVYHPPDRPLNSLISFLNSLLYTACISELYRTALYPGISYLHTPQTRRCSLALDLVEPFKPLLCDRLLFRLLNMRIVSDKDFITHTNGFILTDESRKKVLTEWDNELKKTVFHTALNRSVSYRQLLRRDCYKLINFLLEEKEYTPYRIPY